MADGQVKTKLGPYEYVLYPQKYGRLRNRLGDLMKDLEGGNLIPQNTTNIVAVFGGVTYNLLQVFIPDIMPEHEFEGFPTREAMEADEYDEDYDHSPTSPEIDDALTKAWQLNAGALNRLKNLISPGVIRAMIEGKLLDWMMNASETSSVTSGPDTPSTTSGTPVLTSAENTD